MKISVLFLGIENFKVCGLTRPTLWVIQMSVNIQACLNNQLAPSFFFYQVIMTRLALSSLMGVEKYFAARRLVSPRRSMFCEKKIPLLLRAIFKLRKYLSFFKSLTLKTLSKYRVMC